MLVSKIETLVFDCTLLLRKGRLPILAALGQAMYRSRHAWPFLSGIATRTLTALDGFGFPAPCGVFSETSFSLRHQAVLRDGRRPFIPHSPLPDTAIRIVHTHYILFITPNPKHTLALAGYANAFTSWRDVYMDALGPRIKQLRIDAGLSKAALARRVGVSDVTISYWESGTIKQIGHERLIALADALHCPLERLLEDATTVATPTASQRITENVPGNTHLLALHTVPPVPWEAHTLAAPLPASGTAIDALVRGCYLVTPGSGETFAYLEAGDIAAILPTSHFRQEGLYLLEWRHALTIQYLSHPEPETLRITDPAHHTNVDSNQPFPFRIAGRLQARWQQRDVSD